MLLLNIFIQMGKKVKQNQEQSKKVQIKCSICLERKPKAQLNCSHNFCYRCINRWARSHKTCPVCRAEILSIQSGNRRIEFSPRQIIIRQPIIRPQQTIIPQVYARIFMVPCIFYRQFLWNYYNYYTTYVPMINYL